MVEDSKIRNQIVTKSGYKSMTGAGLALSFGAEGSAVVLSPNLPENCCAKKNLCQFCQIFGCRFVGTVIEKELLVNRINRK